MSILHSLAAIVGLISLGVAASYAVIVFIAVLIWRASAKSANPSRLPAVTLLKPLCGMEPGLYENLRSFCRQNFPEFQIVFGVHLPSDPALSVARRLAAEFPRLAIDVVINPQQHGSNGKVNNLTNMLPLARHEVLVIADADTYVKADYLTIVTSPLLDPTVGLVSCIYRDVPTKGIWSSLGAMYINEWYMPSVLLARLFGHAGYASGQTLCFRRATLQAIGGFQALSNHLAEDYRLGELIRELGLKIVLSPVPIMAEHHEPALDSLIRHELRWMRTIRALRPRSFRMIFLSFTLPLTVSGLLLAINSPTLSTTAWVLSLTAVLARIWLHFVQNLRGGQSAFSQLWLLPACDLLILWAWLRSFFTSRISWRGVNFDVEADGVMHRAS